MKKKHKVIILRGLPGSGKSEFRNSLRDHILISMDLYWVRDGQEYEFKYSELQDAVKWMKDKFMEALEQEKDAPKALIVVDNTHTRLWEMDFFRTQAQKAGWMVQISHIEEDVMQCMARGQHPVPPVKMLEMRDRWEAVATKRLTDRVMALEEIALEQIKFGRSRERGDDADDVQHGESL